LERTEPRAARGIGRPGDSYDRFVRLFTPVSAEEADRLERGMPLDGPLYWTDQPVREEAGDDAIWMVMTIPYEDLADANEQPVHPGLGYREFELPPALSAVFPVERLGPAAQGWILKMLSAKRLKGSSGALDAGGAPPDTERAIPGSDARQYQAVRPEAW